MKTRRLNRQLRSQARPGFALATLVLLGACSAGSPVRMEDPAPALPAHWNNASHEVSADAAAAGAIDAQWWQAFGNKELDALITTAQAQSLDMAAAVARVRAAEAQARVSAAGRWPMLAASAGAGRDGSLKHGDHSTSYALGLNASYEVDFWGRQGAQAASGLAALQARRFDRDTVRLTVQANVARQWLQTVALREQLAIAKRNLQNAQDVLSFIEAQARNGAATALALAQQRALVAGQQRSLAALQQQVEDSRLVLATLLGQNDLAVDTDSLAAVAPPPLPDAGLPADLLVRRPDIASAEAGLAEADANIHVARAALLPQFTLSTDLTSKGDTLRTLTDNPLYALAANLSAPLFNGGRLRAQHEVTLANREALLADYRKAVIDAVADVEHAFNAIAGVDAQIAAQTDELAYTRRAFELAEARYRAGAETLLTLLTNQNALFAAEYAAIALRSQRLQASVDLYRALGGGWSRDQPQVAALPE